jgi:hypothetical protein
MLLLSPLFFLFAFLLFQAANVIGLFALFLGRAAHHARRYGAGRQRCGVPEEFPLSYPVCAAAGGTSVLCAP